MQREEIKSLELNKVTVLNASGVVIFEDLTLSIPLERFCWVKGAGGSGRSTFLKLLNGLVQFTEGSYQINGEAVEAMDESQLQKYRLNMGYSFDFGGLLSNRTLYENLLLPLSYHAIGTPKSREEKVNQLLQAFQVDSSKIHLRPAEVQGSVRKVICVARAFVLDPELVFLDDPTAGMNAYARVAFREFLRTRRQRGLKHVFVTSDDTDFWREFIDDVLLVEKGKVRNVGGIAA